MPGWYVAIVSNNTERAVAARIGAAGFETYVATQSQIRIWNNGRRARIDRVLIPAHVFIRCTEAERRRLVTDPGIRRFLTDKARRSNGLAAPPAIIPQQQIDTLRFMLGQNDHPIDFTSTPYRVGDKIKVIRGSLRGLEGEVLSSDTTPSDTRDIIVRLDILGSARVSIPSTDLMPS